MKFYWAGVLLIPVLLGACKDEKTGRFNAPKTETIGNKLLEDSAIALVQTGDVVFRLGNDVTSYMLSQLNYRDKSYSHCGVAVVENGKVFILHAIGGEFNPDQKIKKEPAEKWFSPKNNLAIGIARFDLDSNQRTTFVATVKKYYQDEKKFDLNFDIATDDRLYCAEMIYKAVRLASKDTAYIPVTQIFHKRYVGVDDLLRNAHTRIICQLQYK